jgi:hypothetical protein
MIWAHGKCIAAYSFSHTRPHRGSTPPTSRDRRSTRSPGSASTIASAFADVQHRSLSAFTAAEVLT